MADLMPATTVEAGNRLLGERRHVHRLLLSAQTPRAETGRHGEALPTAPMMFSITAIHAALEALSEDDWRAVQDEVVVLLAKAYAPVIKRIDDRLRRMGIEPPPSTGRDEPIVE